MNGDHPFFVILGYASFYLALVNNMRDFLPHPLLICSFSRSTMSTTQLGFNWVIQISLREVIFLLNSLPRLLKIKKIKSKVGGNGTDNISLKDQSYSNVLELKKDDIWINF